jgi:uncharacterized protein DUF1707
MSAMYAGDQDRESAAASLREHYVRGRLSVEELSSRTGRVLTARSRSDIRTALAGLPLLPEAFGVVGYGRIAQVALRGAILFALTAAYVVFTCTLLLVLSLVLIFSGASATTLVGFLVVWLVPTYLLTRLWRRRST